MIIDRQNACDVELTGNLLGLWQRKWLVIGSAQAAADGQTGRGLGRVLDNAVLGDGEASLASPRLLLREKSRDSGQTYPPCFRQRPFLPLAGGGIL